MKSLRLLFLFILLAVPLLAHDTWLIPSALRTTPGTTVDVRLATSEAFPTSEVAASPDRIARQSASVMPAALISGARS